uniref:OrNV_gp028-like protein n=1 Tax=Nilaparvata lugens endogenous nudivirus TaxID=1487700 RepID=X5GWC6_9VIRU|nr:OrNV_gp028-like protein [Nilaparvata lugens endogenous nudivirus]
MTEGQDWSMLLDWNSLAEFTPYSPIMVRRGETLSSSSVVPGRYNTPDEIKYYKDKAAAQKLTDINTKDYTIVNLPDTITHIPIGSLHSIVNSFSSDSVDYRFCNIRATMRDDVPSVSQVVQDNQEVGDDFNAPATVENVEVENPVLVNKTITDNPMTIDLDTAKDLLGQRWITFLDTLNASEARQANAVTEPDVYINAIAVYKNINPELMNAVLNGSNQNVNRYTMTIGMAHTLLNSLTAEQLAEMDEVKA